MKGINYVIDETGHKRAVMIDLQELSDMWEDFYDICIVEKRASEPRETLAEVKRRLVKAGKLPK